MKNVVNSQEFKDCLTANREGLLALSGSVGIGCSKLYSMIELCVVVNGLTITEAMKFVHIVASFSMWNNEFIEEHNVNPTVTVNMLFNGIIRQIDMHEEVQCK